MNGTSGIASSTSSFGRVVFDGYAVCQDFPLDEGRLYSTASTDGAWVSLGQGVWVYPHPERLSVSIEGVNKGSIELSERELDAMDPLQFSAKLRKAGYSAPKGSAWYILDYVRSAVDSGTAVTPFGTRPASCWPESIFRGRAGKPWHCSVPESAGRAGMAR